MYGGEGRSGHHRESVGNHWQDWSGVSPNGRQFRNEFTDLTRDLAGSEYWKARKVNNPSECDLANHFNNNGSANMQCYAEDKPKTRAKARQKTAFERVSLADTHYSRLEKLSQDLDAELEAGVISMEEWVYGRKQLDARLDKAWARLCKERGWSPEEKDEEIYSLCLDEMEAKRQQKQVDSIKGSNVSFAHELSESLSDDNMFKKPLKKLLTAKEKLSRILDIIKQ